MIREVSGLPNEPLPLCTPAHKVQHYQEGISHVGPDPLNIQYSWAGPLGRCKWNKKAMVHLANKYHDLFQGGKILYNSHILPYNSTISIKDFEKKIRIRLQQTQMHWNNANQPQNNKTHDTDVPTIPLPTPVELANLWMKESRIWHHGAKV